MTLRSNALAIKPLTPTIGALVSGIDLGDLSDGAVDDLRAALLKHQVLFMEGQSLTPVQQRDAAARFGSLHTHPLYPGHSDAPEIMMLDYGPDKSTDDDHWHTDVTYEEAPAMGAILYAERVPSSGGDTLWSSMTAAYKALSKPMRDFLDGLSAVHDFTHAFPAEGQAGSDAGRERYEKARAAHPPVVHPVVRTHPETGELALFVNSVFTSRIKGLRREESRALLDLLYRHIQQPEFCVRWKWSEGAVAFWDNRCTQHYAVNDYRPERRTLRRATLNGDKPYFRPAA